MPIHESLAPPEQEAKVRKKILIIDDERDIVEFVDYNLRREQFETVAATDGLAALKSAREMQPDLILLDLMLPGIDGLEVCRQLKSTPETEHIPIIMLTAKGEEADIVAGLEIGADDYVPKPFSMRLLLARIRAVLRRSARAGEAEPRVVRAGELRIDDDRHEVSLGGAPLLLTLTEYKLLRFLARHPGRVFTRSQILNNIQDEDVLVIERSIDVHVAAVRRKLGESSRLIETVRGVGYRFQG
jgi:two-component system alkaline phosphatase synthesis response regulator PhoP